MSKKDFVAIAAALRSIVDATDGSGTWSAQRVLFGAIERIADVCAESNDSFDRKRFLHACGI